MGDRVVAGRYRLGEQLGSGGMGTVWQAEDLLLGREVAVKEVSFPAGIADADAEVLRERTRREARAAARLNHPNAVTVYDVVEEHGRPWLVMELVPARTLAQTVAQDGPLPVARVATVGLAVLAALRAAHRLGIVHRDVKPSNILLAPAVDGWPERLVLTDFGIATTTGESSLTGTGLLLGSPAYIAPERVQGRQPEPAADLWSLGATLFTAVEGRPPFDRSDPLLTVSAVVSGDHAPFRLAGPLAPVLAGLLTKDPDLRLDAAGTQTQLQAVADSARHTAPDPAASAPTVVLPRPAPLAEASGGTAVLHLDQVHRRLAAAPAPAADASAVAPPRVATPAAPRVATPAAPVATPAVPRVATPAARPPATRGTRFPPAGAGTAPAARPPTPAPVRGSGSRRPAGAIAIGLLALAVLAGGGLALLRSGGGRTPAAGGTPAAGAPGTAGPGSAHPSATGTSAPSSTARKTPSAATNTGTGSGAGTGSGSGTGTGTGSETGAGPVPAGWTRRTGPTGWVAALPASYTAGSFGGSPEYRDTSTGRTLRISTGQGRPDPVADRQEQARAFARRHPSYQEVAIRPLTYRGYPAADWEFTYEGLHVLDRVVDIRGRGYSLYWQTRASDFPSALPTARQAFAAFRPAG